MPEPRALHSLEDLDAFARDFLKAFPNGAVVGLSGELGAGKTTFVRAVVRQLCFVKGIAEPKVTSPTFVLHQSYPSLGVEHFDLYRLENVTGASLIEIGYPEAVERSRISRGYLFVEWPERVTEAKELGADVQIDISLIGSARTAVWALRAAKTHRGKKERSPSNRTDR